MRTRTSAVSKLSSKQLSALAVIVGGGTNQQAAEAVGVAPGRISVWLRDETFRDELKRALEKMWQTFESRIAMVGNRGTSIIDTAMSSDDPDTKLAAAKIGVNAAVRMASRYKTLQIEGFVPPPVPLVIFPEGTRMPWAAPALPVTAQEPIDTEAEIVDDDTDIDTI